MAREGENYRKGYRHQIMKYMCICGVLPWSVLALINKNGGNEIKRAANRMVKEGTLAKEQNSGRVKKVVIENGAERVRYEERYKRPYLALANIEEKKEVIEKGMPKGYIEYYQNISSLNLDHIRYKNRTNGERVANQARTIIMMEESGIAAMPDEKPNLLREEVEISEETACYYSSREIKNGMEYKAGEIETNGKKQVAWSRASGCMVTPGGIYTTYTVGESLPEWIGHGEVRMAMYIGKLMNKKYQKYKTAPVIQIDESIVLYENQQNICRIVEETNEEKKRFNLINTEVAYKHMYGVPLDENGKKMLSLMSQSGWKKEMIENMIEEEEYIRSENCSVECDGYDGNKYKLLFCIPDLTKLRYFLQRAKLEKNPDKFVIYGFEWQAGILSYLAKGYASVWCVEMDDYLKERNQKV